MMRFVLLLIAWVPLLASAFSPVPALVSKANAPAPLYSAIAKDIDGGDATSEVLDTRRSVLAKVARSALATSVVAGPVVASPHLANAAVGNLPEFADTNAILQGITVDVADQSQQESMIKFLEDAFDFKVLRRNKLGSVTDTWLGFGPEQLSIPNDFEMAVSSFAKYGGHASIHIRYDSKSTEVLYRKGDNAPGENIAFLQVGVPAYRISQMVQNGGNVLDAYGYVNVVSPCGLPMRGIVGIWPDPIMFVAINTQDIGQSLAFYKQLGFVEEEYPYARPSKGAGQFEPAQPPKSVYLAPSKNSMGVLLLPAKGKKSKIVPNPVLRSLNIVYNPSGGGNGAESASMELEDPSKVGISFTSVGKFEKERTSAMSMPQT